MPFVSYKLFLFLLTNRTGCRSNLWQIERRVAKAESYWAKRESNVLLLDKINVLPNLVS